MQERHHGPKATLAPTLASVSMNVGYGTQSPTPAPTMLGTETPALVSKETAESSGEKTSKGGLISVSVHVG